MTLNEIIADMRSDRKKKVIIDTDTYNEMDDQYAIAYALGSDKMDVIAINAAPFHNDRSRDFEDGMEKSYDEILRVLRTAHREGTCDVCKGSRTRIGDNVDFAPSPSDAADRIIQAAREADEMLYILTTGACSNVASAIMMAPDIKDKICVIWLGGHCLEYKDLGEFNLAQDYVAGQIMLNSGVNLLLLPAVGDEGHGTQMLRTRRDRLTNGIKGNSDACVFFRDTLPDEFHEENWERIIWDIAAPAALSVPQAFEISIIPAPVFADSWKYAFDKTRHKIMYMEKLDAETVFDDAFACISKL